MRNLWVSRAAITKMVGIMVAVVLVVATVLGILAYNKFSSQNALPIPTPSPTPSSTLSPSPTNTPTPNPDSAVTIRYWETNRWDTGTGAVEITITMIAQNHEGSSRNMLLDEFYLTVDGAEVPVISQTTGNFYIDPNDEYEATLGIRVEEIETDYRLNYRDSSFNIEWIKAASTVTPTPNVPYVMTLTYWEKSRQNVVNGSGVIMPIEEGVFLTIGLHSQIHDGSDRMLIYDDFYVTVNGVEVPAVMQLSGSWGFQGSGESQVWFIFEEIGSNYVLNYRDNSFTIEWIKQ